MRRFVLVLLLGMALPAVLPAAAHEGHDHSVSVDVVELEGPLDQRILDFVAEVIEETRAALVVLRVDSSGVASGDVASLANTMRSADIPIVAWVGPQGARAYGGSLQLAVAADYVGAAPGVMVGFAVPTVAGDPVGSPVVLGPGLEELANSRIELRETSRPGFVAGLTPSIGQFIASLDSLEIGGTVIETAEQFERADGSVFTQLSVVVRFLEPGLFTRFLRISIRPEAAFFFLVAGLALIAFELYAAGVGVVAAVAALSLFLSVYGLSALPVRWWAIALSVMGLLAYTWDFQRNELGWKSLFGTTALLVGGLYVTDADPQFGPRWWTVVIVVAGIGAFYLFAMTAMVRSRFSTRTIGREYLIGRAGVAQSTFTPEGVVSVEGARWKGRASRVAGIQPGDRVTVLAVEGIVLEVAPEVQTPWDDLPR